VTGRRLAIDRERQEQPSQEGLATAFYLSAREEIVMRLERRDQTTVLYLAGISAIVGLAIRSDTPDELVVLASVLLIWLLTVGATALYLQHTTVVSRINLYLRTEWRSSVGGDWPHGSHWDASDTLRDSRDHRNWRSLAVYFLLIAPAAATTEFLCIYGVVRTSHNLAWWVGVGLCALLTALLWRYVRSDEKARAAIRSLPSAP
jgi:hypothetical protein